MMKPLKHLSLFAILGAFGCSYNARAPEQYRADTAALLETQQAAVKQCYDNILRTDPAVSGNVAIKFTVKEETGEIASPAIDTNRTTAPEPLAQCVLQAITNLRLMPPDDNDGYATFVYEFRVNPASETTVMPSG